MQERRLFPEKRRQRPPGKTTQAQDDEHRRGDPMELLLFLVLLLHLLLGIQRAEQADCDPKAQQAQMMRRERPWKKQKQEAYPNTEDMGSASGVSAKQRKKNQKHKQTHTDG